MNARTLELVGRFLDLRAQGWTFDKIAAELKVGRRTLIRWSRINHHELHNLRAIHHEAQADQLGASRPKLLEHVSRQLTRLQEELDKRDLAEIPAARLFQLVASLRAESLRLSGDLRFSETRAKLAPEEIKAHEAADIISWDS